MPGDRSVSRCQEGTMCTKRCLTCVACDPAPRRHHGQQPLEHEPLDVPERGAVPYSERLEQQQVQAVGRDGHAVVEDHEHEPEPSREENPAQFAGPVQELCHPETRRLEREAQRRRRVSISPRGGSPHTTGLV